MRLSDEDLRHGVATVGALHHLGLALGLRQNVDLGEVDALLFQQAFGRVAKAAERRGVDFDWLHDARSMLFDANLSILGDTRQCQNAHILRASRESGLCCGRERGTGGHHVIDDQHRAIHDQRAAGRIDADRIAEHGVSGGAVEALEGLRALSALQQVEAVRLTGLTRERLHQQGGLIVAPPEHARPVQRHRRKQRVGLQERCCGAGKPFRRRADDIMPVAMFEREHEAAAILMIEQRGPAT